MTRRPFRYRGLILHLDHTTGQGARPGLEAWIEAVRVDDVSARPRRGKRAVMEEALAEAGLAPAEVLVVGDLVEGEIAAGLALGAGTLHVARSSCPGCPADRCVPDLCGIASLA